MAQNHDDEIIVNMDKITVLDQLRSIKLLISKICDKTTEYKDFMIFADRLMAILAEEALASVPAVVPQEIITPTEGIYNGLRDTRSKQLCVVSIIRAGDTLLEAFRKLEPGIRVGKILIQRNEESENKDPVFFYKKLPSDIANCQVLLVDPMIGTAGSSICALDCLRTHGVDPKNIIFVNLFCCKYGLKRLQTAYPDVQVITLDMNSYLNENKYLVPGIGDFGDRYYGTNH